MHSGFYIFWGFDQYFRCNAQMISKTGDSPRYQKHPPTAHAVGGFHREAMKSTIVDFIRPTGGFHFSCEFGHALGCIP